MKTLIGVVCALMALTGLAKESVVFVCAHPDDFGGISGTGMRLAEKFDVHVIDYTHGERGLGEEGSGRDVGADGRHRFARQVHFQRDR